MRASLLVLGLGLFGCQRALAPERQFAAEVEDRLTVILARDLITMPADSRRVVVDVRSAEAFAAGHVPGAVHLDVKLLRAEVDGVPEQLAPRAGLEAALSAIGVDLLNEVIVVDERNTPQAARVVWTLLYFGHAPAKVKLLDGGWSAWVARQGPQSVAAGTVLDGKRTALGVEQARLRVDADWVRAHLVDTKVMLVDVRSDEEWAAGRIPGAKHMPWQQAVGEDGRLLAREELAGIYASVMGSPTAVVYCNSGMRASLTWLVLATLGHPDVRVYDGSWNEWGARADLPKER
jgi:thiosulfate/3-mercaptopyruvate sulfurtransferase